MESDAFYLTNHIMLSESTVLRFNFNTVLFNPRANIVQMSLLLQWLLIKLKKQNYI